MSLMLAGVGLMLMMAANGNNNPTGSVALQPEVVSPTPTETLDDDIPPTTPLPTLTPSKTLRPPPTFEPPTHTPPPSSTPSETPPPTYGASVIIPGVHGLETPTPSSTPGCELRKDWQLVYEVKANDALARIAQEYNTYVDDLVEGNCLTDPDVIQVGQKLRVPGEAHPYKPLYECVAWEVLTPIDHASGIDSTGQLTFNWRGPKSERHLIRVFDGNGNIVWERTVDLRQNETIGLKAEKLGPGHYQWQVYPLNLGFQQIDCLESPKWSFDVVEF